MFKLLYKLRIAPIESADLKRLINTDLLKKIVIF
jgi:hypothetical protein